MFIVLLRIENTDDCNNMEKSCVTKNEIFLCLGQYDTKSLGQLRNIQKKVNSGTCCYGCLFYE